MDLLRKREGVSDRERQRETVDIFCLSMELFSSTKEEGLVLPHP